LLLEGNQLIRSAVHLQISTGFFFNTKVAGQSILPSISYDSLQQRALATIPNLDSHPEIFIVQLPGPAEFAFFIDRAAIANR